MRLSYFYGLLVWRLVELWYSLRGADAERRIVHHERLRALSAHWKIAEEKLLALDALRREPVTRRFWKLLAALFIDRMLLGVVALATAGVLVGQLHGCGRRLARWRRWWRSPASTRCSTTSGSSRRRPSCARRTGLIQRLVCAPFIVFGHSHTPETVPLDGGATYFNTGTWASDDGAARVHAPHGRQRRERRAQGRAAAVARRRLGAVSPLEPSRTISTAAPSRANTTRMPIHPDLLEIVRCPKCQGKVDRA